MDNRFALFRVRGGLIPNVLLIKPITHLDVYNFKVEDFYTYFVSDFGIWVHNTNTNDCTPGGTGNISPVIKNGKVIIESAQVNPNEFNGKTAVQIAKMLSDQGYDVTVQASTKSRSGAMIIKINNTGGERNITQFQVSPGGGRHGESPYVKISTSNQGTIKIVDGKSENYVYQ
ncbi:hypothetical protein SAMN04487969_13412 [Paenibacillus algorifonticola]|uniref:Intein C-terminal splicing region n=1 Tax=Paenibacillus algorifonticola TaxID=684063 RepID=A0A1I2IGK1_9BACL|nr:hypothetical protein [Paenibacillus algorifonticola]SFF40187.1 hypothetical protein SAMN04487969_13412 [Paenibacillus algorifonticola]